MAQSSIHIEAGHAGYLGHNDRSENTVNSIFKNNKNDVWNDKTKAFSIYRKELSKRTSAYTKRTNQKLQSKSITHLSAIVNLNSNHKMQDLKKIKSLLEKELDTKVFQIALHRDEGHISDDKKEVVNYHAHIEFMGLDSDGHSVRKKLTKKFLSDLQSDVSMVLGMERGKNYAKNQEPRPRRLSTHDFKQHKKLEQEQRQKIAVENKKELEVQEKNSLVTLKEVNAENKRLRKLLQDNQASREAYAKLETIIKELKAKARAKDLQHDELIISLHEIAYTKIPDYDLELEKVVEVKVPYKELYEDKVADYDKLKNDSYLDEELLKEELINIAYPEEDIYDPENGRMTYKELYEDKSNELEIFKEKTITNDNLQEKTTLALARFEVLVEKLKAKGIDIYELAEDTPKPTPPRNPNRPGGMSP